jgi:tetratricopeptide (TPR) repeat protein
MVLTLLLLLLAAQSGSPPLTDLLTRARQDLETSDRPAARRELTQALRLYPASPAVYNFLGVLEAAEGNYREAERRFREAVGRSPQYTDAYLNLGRLYQENGTQDPQAATKALAVYQAILRYAPDHAEARFQSAALLQTLGQFDRSLEELGRLPAADQDRPAALAVRCADHVGRGERAEANEAAAKVIARADLAGPDVRPILPMLAAHGREDLARQMLSALRARGQALPDDLRSLGLLQEKEGQLALAREVLEEAAQGVPDQVALLLDLARVAYKERDYQGALGYLGHARALEPGNARIHFFFGMVCVDLDLGAEAYKSLKEAVRLDPENAAANYAMGAVALHRKDASEAIPYFRKYSELRPDDLRGPFAVGIAAFQAKDFTTARAELVPAAARPETAAAANYFLARMARAENEYEEALRFAQKAVEADPGYADPYSELGLLYLRLGQPERAEQALRRCLEIDPEHYLGNLHLLMLYTQTKDPRYATQSERFAEVEKRWVQKATDFLRPIEVRPY